MENLILSMENWGTYRQSEGALNVYSNRSCRLVEVESFTLDNIPRADALLVFDAYPRAAKYAAMVAMTFEQKYGFKPEFLTCGGYSNKGVPQPNSKTQAEWFEFMFKSWGFSAEWLRKNHMCSQSTTNRMNILEIRDLIRNSAELKKIGCPTVLTVTGCGYTLRAAQELCIALPGVRFVFFETPLTPPEERYFDSEALNRQGLGWGIDTVLATVFHCKRFWNIERAKLPREKILTAPDLQLIRDFVKAGYALYFTYPDMWEALEIDPKQGMELCRHRRLQLFGTDEYGHQLCNAPLSDAQNRLEKHIERLIEESAAEFRKMGLSPR